MKRLLLFLALFAVAILVLRRWAGALASAAGRRTDGAPHGDPRRGATEMVRDKVCNMFLPKDRALSLESSGEVLYFCSEACRSRHLSTASRQSGAA